IPIVDAIEVCEHRVHGLRFRSALVFLSANLVEGSSEGHELVIYEGCWIRSRLHVLTDFFEDGRPGLVLDRDRANVSPKLIEALASEVFFNLFPYFRVFLLRRS